MDRASITKVMNAAADGKFIREQTAQIISYPRRVLAWFVNEIRWLFRVLVSSGDRFYWDNGFSKAASLAYSSLLSFFPLCALGFGLMASFGVFSSYLTESNVQRYLFGQFIPSSEVVDALLETMNEFNTKSSLFQIGGRDVSQFGIGVTVICFFVITSLLLINAVEYALNETWQVFESRSIPQRIAIFCAILLIGPVLFISAFYFVKSRVEPFLIGALAGPYLSTIYNYLVPFLIDYFAFVGLYYLVPKAPVKFGSASFGAFIAALLFGFAKASFALYVESYASYDLYGIAATIPIFLFWLYLAWIIVLFGTECCYQAQYLPIRGKVWKRSVMTVGDARMVLGIQSLVMIARAFNAGTRVPNDIELAETLGCSSVVLKPAIHALERAGIVSRGDATDMPLTLMKSPDKITLWEIREALFGERLSVHFPEEVSRTFTNFIDPSGNQKVTLYDIMREEKA